MILISVLHANDKICKVLDNVILGESARGVDIYRIENIENVYISKQKPFQVEIRMISGSRNQVICPDVDSAKKLVNDLLGK